MNETSWSWIVFSGYFLAIILIAWRSRRQTRSFQLFSVGSRAINPVFIGLSVAASATSSATFINNPGLVYLYGWSGFVAIYGASTLGFFAGLIVFSKRFRNIGDEFTALTLPQWIGDRYHSEALKLLFAALSLLQVAYLVLIAVGMAIVLSKTLNVPVFAALSFVVVFTFSYILSGGAGTHVLTNVVQAVIMVIVALVIVGAGLHHLSNGFDEFFDRMNQVAPFYGASVNPNSTLYRDFFETIIVQFVIGLASALLPHVISKALYLRTEADVNVYLGTTIVAELLMKIVLLAGIFARFDLPGQSLTADTVMATYLVEQFSPFVRAFIGLGILAAGFSTMEGILLALSSIFANDFVQPVVRLLKRAEKDFRRQSLALARVFIVALMPVTIWLSWHQIQQPKISVIIFAFNGILGITTASFVPMLVGIYSKRAPLGWITASALIAVALFYAMIFFRLTKYHDNPMVPATMAMFISLVLTLPGMLLASRRSETQSVTTALD